MSDENSTDDIPQIDCRMKWPEHGMEIELTFVVRNGRYNIVRHHEVDGNILVSDLEKEAS